MATPNADNAQYNPGSAADQDARVRRDERITLVAARDRVMRELQELRGTVAVELRTLQALGGGRDATTAITTARRQAAVVALERRLQELEQELAASGPDTEALTPQDEGPEFGVGPSLDRRGPSQQRDTTDIRRRESPQQLAGSASFKQVSSPQSGSVPSATARTQIAQQPDRPESTAPESGGAGTASLLRSRLNQRAARNRTEKTLDREALKNLQAARKPDAVAWGAVTVVAVGIDALDIALTLADVAAGIGTVISIILNIAMFLCIRAIINRGMLVSWALAACMLSGLALLCIGALFGPLSILTSPFALLFFGVVGVAGCFNSSTAPVEKGRDAMEQNIQRMEKSVRVARQTTAKAIRFARRAGKYSKRVAKLTRSVVKSKTFRTLTKSTKTVGKLLARIGGPAANSVPIIRLLPFQLLTVWLTYRGLKRDYQEAQELLAQYAATAQEEVQAVTEAEVMRAEVEGAETEEAMLAEEPVAPPQVPQRPAAQPAIRTASVTDIARPGSGVSSTIRPIQQQRPNPVASVPMRDVAAAA